LLALACARCLLTLHLLAFATRREDLDNDGGEGRDEQAEEHESEDEAEDGGPENGSSANDAREEFVSLLVTLGFSTQQARILLQRFLIEDPVVKAAVEVFRLENDTADFRDTLMRVVNHNDRQPDDAVAAPAAAVDKITSDSGARAPVMIETLVEKGLLSAAEATALLALFESGDVMFAAAIDAFQVDENIEELYDTIKRLAKATMS